MDDLLSSLLGGQPTDEEKMLALASVLKKQGNPQVMAGLMPSMHQAIDPATNESIGKQQFLGLLSNWVGQPETGKALTKDAENRQNFAEKGQERALQRAFLAQKDQELNQHKTMMEGLYGRRLDLNKEGLDLKGDEQGINPITGQPYLKHAPASGATPPPAPGGIPKPQKGPAKLSEFGFPPDQPMPMPGTKAGNALQKQLDDLGKSMTAARGNPVLNKLVERKFAADRVDSEALDENGTVRNLTPQQMRSLATHAATLTSGGSSSPALAQIEEMVQHTYAGDWANFKQKISNEPQGADAQKFIKLLLLGSSQEKGTIGAQIKELLAPQIANHQEIIARFPNRAWSRIKAASGFTPDMFDESHQLRAPINPVAEGQKARGEERQRQASVEGGAAQSPLLSPDKQKRLEELRKKQAEGTLK